MEKNKYHMQKTGDFTMVTRNINTIINLYVYANNKLCIDHFVCNGFSSFRIIIVIKYKTSKMKKLTRL